MSDRIHPKQVVSATEMAALVGLSRQRFWQLRGRVFPFPVYDMRTRRPMYPAELITQCLMIRQTGVGIDGRPVLFYAKHSLNGRKRVSATPKTAQVDDAVADVLEGIRALGLTSATSAQVGAAMKALYPAGVEEQDRGELIRAVFLHFSRQNHGNNVRR